MDDKKLAPDISAFLASAIHDMKNSVCVLIDFLNDNIGQLNPEAQRTAAPMLYQVQRLNDNLIQMLAIYKVGNQFYPFDLTENSVEGLINDIVNNSQTLLEYHGIELELDIDTDLLWYFDYELVSGVIGHALHNAAHYTHDKLKLSAQEINGELVIRVEDNGRGYPPAMLETGNEIRKGVDFASGSTGLGLYFSAMVARLHRNRDKTGSIQLENGGTYGGGCFILQLP